MPRTRDGKEIHQFSWRFWRFNESPEQEHWRKHKAPLGHDDSPEHMRRCLPDASTSTKPVPVEVYSFQHPIDVYTQGNNQKEKERVLEAVKSALARRQFKDDLVFHVGVDAKIWAAAG